MSTTLNMLHTCRSILPAQLTSKRGGATTLMLATTSIFKERDLDHERAKESPSEEDLEAEAKPGDGENFPSPMIKDMAEIYDELVEAKTKADENERQLRLDMVGRRAAIQRARDEQRQGFAPSTREVAAASAVTADATVAVVEAVLADVWSPIIAYRDGNASVPNIVFMFVGSTTGTTTGHIPTKVVAGDARILMTTCVNSQHDMDEVYTSLTTTTGELRQYCLVPPVAQLDFERYPSLMGSPARTPRPGRPRPITHQQQPVRRAPAPRSALAQSPELWQASPPAPVPVTPTRAVTVAPAPENEQGDREPAEGEHVAEKQVAEAHVADDHALRFPNRLRCELEQRLDLGRSPGQCTSPSWLSTFTPFAKSSVEDFQSLPDPDTTVPEPHRPDGSDSGSDSGQSDEVGQADGGDGNVQKWTNTLGDKAISQITTTQQRVQHGRVSKARKGQQHSAPGQGKSKEARRRQKKAAEKARRRSRRRRR
ncbi:hypothetical protein CONLIGDRAFT_677989 [Coniochaeta ligniaria NRRL 30616]|uniref:Uncharacterized protein n=1 Tax=Coniochaeta ligniaria NRRL 30616 TaxID=1408157 RepID=A0A1J7IW39_9PEZI|nr:hypothetical protein CONLIGDRAFT_677989 [Coniochaeta ligniaria NRRL 30616]